MRRYIGFDTETYPITPEDPFPLMVCSQLFIPGDTQGRIFLREEARVVLPRIFKHALDSQSTIIGHNVKYDMCVAWRAFPELGDLIWQLYDAGLVEDTLIRDKLNDIARGYYNNKKHNRFRMGVLDSEPKPYFYSLGDCIRLHFGQIIEGKDDEENTRVRFDRYDGVPVDRWDEKSRVYAANDPVWTVTLAHKQDADEAREPARVGGPHVFTDAAAQTYTDFCAALERWIGVRTDAAHIMKLESILRAEMAQHDDALRSPTCARCAAPVPCPFCGQRNGARGAAKTQELKCACCARPWGTATTLRCGSCGTQASLPPFFRFMSPSDIREGNARKNTKLVQETVVDVCAANGLSPKKTKNDGISIDAEQIEALEKFEPRLKKLVEYSKAQKILGYVDGLKAGAGAHPLHPSWNVLVANGRMSCSAPNLTNLPRKIGVRESFVPPQGYVFGFVDYSQLELCTFAQVALWLFGYSRMAELINAGTDLHNTVTSNFLGISIEEFQARRAYQDEHGVRDGEVSYEKMRAGGKIANFGFLGGMGIDKFMSNNRKVVTDAKLTRNDVIRLKKVWLETFPELRQYFSLCDRIQRGEKQIVQFVSNRIRGGLNYCDLANTFFSGLAADGAKAGMRHAQRALWYDRSSPVYGQGYAFAFIHDENAFALRAQNASASLDWLYDLLMRVMQAFTPDVRVKGSRAIALRWRKNAKEYRVNGELRPYEESPAFAELAAQGKEWVDEEEIVNSVPEVDDDDFDPVSDGTQTPDADLVPGSGEVHFRNGVFP